MNHYLNVVTIRRCGKFAEATRDVRLTGGEAGMMFIPGGLCKLRTQNLERRRLEQTCSIAAVIAFSPVSEYSGDYLMRCGKL